MTYTPSQSVRARAQGETEDEYRNYLRITQGETQRQDARNKGIDTNGQYWTGNEFKTVDSGPEKWMADHWPLVLGATVAAPFAIGAIGGGAGAGAGGATAATSAAPAAATGGSSMFGGLTLADILKGGTSLASMWLGNAGNNKSINANAAASQAALDFAKQQFAQQTATDDARYNAYERRRQPFRQASQDALVQLKALLGMTR